MAYSALAGRPESLGQSLGWAIVNLVPWLLAIEAAKRASNWAVASLALIAAAIASLALGWTIAEDFAADAYANRGGTVRHDLLVEPFLEWARRVTAR